MKKNFHEVKLIGNIDLKELPLLVISNHSTWWDGFWLMHLNLKVLKRKFHFMMLESQLRKFWFFNYSGGFSIHKKSKTIFETFDYTAKLLSEKQNLVIVFPQGEITSIHNQNIKFEKGIEKIINRMKNKISIVMVVNLVDYFSNPKPTLYQYIKEFDFENFQIEDLEAQYNVFYKESIDNQVKIKC